MSIKLDMLKVYDRVEWSFLRAILTKLEFSEKWVGIIMDYITSVTYSVLANGHQTGFFKPSRGLRQGDPLSPYLFIICTEGHIALIHDACLKGIIKGIRLGPMLELLSHLFFANVTLFLGEASVEEASNFKESGLDRSGLSWKVAGFPTIVGGSKKAIFTSLVERVKHR
ncbi:hypothetical protein LIER_43744 [Lithospermum erythrorhizon]|uniref:Reverse transcriptase domain-containing protein n=1 Tax=Lithospermum erythrorhizon TaxID=34254 RepID=A0AAV3QTY7_LITER